MTGDLVAIAALGLLVGLALGWAVAWRRAARRERVRGGSRIEVLENEVRRLDSRTDELAALLDVAGQDTARLRAELAAAEARAAGLTEDLSRARQEHRALEGVLAAERAAREQDRQFYEAAARADDERVVAWAAEVERAHARARDAEVASIAHQARLDARDAAVTELQDQVAALEAQVAGPVPEPDDLRMIDGVGRVLEGMLHEAGITTYRQLADLSSQGGPDEQLDEYLGRIRNEEWSAQALELHRRKYGEDVDRAS